MDRELMQETEAAEQLRISVGTLRNWRCSRTSGPPFIKVGRLVRYRRSDLKRWLDRRTIQTSDACMTDGRND